jgi:NAD(P)H-hydrate epimerase
MNILNNEQTRRADEFTIETEPLSSIDLMERAAAAFTEKFTELYPNPQKVQIVCGLGNNGGDGLVVARILHQNGYDIKVYVVNYASQRSKDFSENLLRLKDQCEVWFVDSVDDFVLTSFVTIDALLGSGLSRKLTGLLAEVVSSVNDSGNDIVAIDSPTGLYTEKPNDESDVIIRATHTITFQAPKLAFLLPQNDAIVGAWHVANIGLNLSFLEENETKYKLVEKEFIDKITKQRSRNAHKGTFGSALLIAGSYGMMGATALSAKSCLRSGVGKLTVHSIPAGNEILQISVPEAMFSPAPDNDSGYINSFFYAGDLEKYQAIGVGPGIGVDVNVRQSLNVLIEVCRELNKPLIIDADGLNNIAQSPLTIARLPEKTVLTPHPGEFKRLVGKSWKNDYERLELLKGFARKNKVVVCLKGANTAVALPDGRVYFNATGNPGLATAGSGDVLTGMILSFLAQGYEPYQAAILGVYEHGLAGDRAAEKRSQRALIAGDIIEEIR